ncbi:uncharacterized protein C9orf40 homolog isoform X1 [Hippoglossus hippoglossus]|uniref:uncharacterized protein C9orf40 homolog isoform X1 n=1 Tax=Hippoglossus hippoglossus TaxID=8267 RepID=UPI00148E64EE|nr:uncharacterized protein C9orf40 homolog isoform X1 [Hippoglossus hippoglossus]
MAKRRAEESLLLLHEFPSKTLPRSLLSVDLQLEADPPAARPVSRSPPALLAVVGGRCRKRPHSSGEPEQKPEEPGVCPREHAADVVTVQTPGGVPERHGSGSPANHKKRPREDCGTSRPGALHKVAAGDSDTGDSDTEDCAFNTFWFWRSPLPKLDLTLLEYDHSHPQTEQRSKVKDRSSDAMET